MAKWGEGDPRWIVEERPDATNVNNWHWTEKNASHWSKDKLKSLLETLIVEDPAVGLCGITEVKSIDGEAVANNRKGKLIFFYEWVIKCSWSGHVNAKEEKINGTLTIPNLSEENSSDDITIDVEIDENDRSDAANILKEMLRVKGLKLIQDRMKEYIIALRNEFAKDMIKPTKVSNDSNINTFQTEVQAKKSSILSSSTINKESTLGPKDAPTNNSSVKFDTDQITLTDRFKCTAKELYMVFAGPPFLEALTRNKVICDPVKDGIFSLLDGGITGKYTELEEYTTIKQLWRLKSWKVGHYSEVTLNFKELDDHTELTLVQTGVPSTEIQRTKDGWKQNFLEPIKRIFGFGTCVF